MLSHNGLGDNITMIGTIKFNELVERMVNHDCPLYN